MLSIEDRFLAKELEFDEDFKLEFASFIAKGLEVFDEKKSEQADKIREVLKDTPLQWDIGKDPISVQGRKPIPDIENKSLAEIEKIFRELSYQGLEDATKKAVAVINNGYLSSTKKSISADKAMRLLESTFKDKVEAGVTFSKGSGGIQIIQEFFKKLFKESGIDPISEFDRYASTRITPKQLKKIKGELARETASAIYNLGNAWFFAGTLNKRLNEIMEAGFDEYLPNFFKANSKIKKSGQMLSKAEVDEIVNDINDIRAKRSLRPIEFASNELEVKTHTFSLPALRSKTGMMTCTSAKECAAFCYAMTGTFQYPNAMAKNEISLLFTLTKEFTEKVIRYLSSITKTTPLATKQNTNKLHIVRIHDSGDFYSLKYLAKWLKIAKSFPTVMFYAYTKQTKLAEQELPPNFIITHSISGKNDTQLIKLIENGIDLKHSKIFTNKKALKKAGYTDTSDDDKGAMKPGKTKVGLVIHNSEKEREKAFIDKNKAKEEAELKKKQEAKTESTTFRDYLEKVEKKKQEIVAQKTVCMCQGKCGCGHKKDQKEKTPKERAMELKQKYMK